MDRQRVVAALVASTVAEEAKAAGEYLDQCTMAAGFGPSLLQLVVEESMEKPVKQAAVIYLKNMTSKYWAREEDAAEEPSFLIPESDRVFIRENLIDAIVSTNVPAVRAQLCVALQNVARKDFPQEWPSLPPKVQSLLQTSSGPHWLGAVTVLHRLSKIYEFKKTCDRSPHNALMAPILPFLLDIIRRLSSNDSEESVLLQKMMLKIVYAMTQFSLNLQAFDLEQLDQWLVVCREVVLRPVPAAVAQLGDKEAQELSQHWKLRKWAAKVLERVFERYGAPGQVESGYAEFAQHFLQTHAVPCVEVFLQVLARRQQGHFVASRVTHLALSFLSTGISHSHTWKAVKPHMMELTRHVIFPLLCHSEEDEEMWEDDVEEFIRFKYDIFEDMNNPCNSAGSLLAAACKRKDVVQPVLGFIVETLTARAREPLSVDGALHMVGELAAQLVCSKKYKKDCEKLLDAHIIPRLRHDSRFVRGRAAWCIKTFSATQFNSPSILKKVAEGVTQRLLDENEELPVKVESAIAMQYLLDDQEDKVPELLRPLVGQVVPAVLRLVAKTQVEELCSVVDELIDKFLDDIVPVAAGIAAELSTLFLSVISADDADERTPTLMSVISTLATILDVVDEHREIMVAVESSVLRVIKAVFVTANIDYYDDVMLLVQSLITSHVSEPMWGVFSDIYTAFKTGNNTVIMFSDIMPILHLYVTTDTEAFLARPERLNCVLEMIKTVVEDNTQGDDNQLSAVKLMEVLLLQCGRGVQEAIPLMMTLVLHRLAQPFEGLSELQPMCICVLVAALYVDEATAVSVMRNLAPATPPLEFIGQQLMLLSKNFDGVHDRKMALLGWCQLLRTQADLRPSVISFHPKKVLEACIFLFEGLQRAMKLQAENRAADDSSDEEEAEESEDEEEEVPAGTHKGKGKGKPSHRRISEVLGDDEDEIDEGTLEYLENLSRVQNEGDDSEEEGEGDGFIEETDSEGYDTPLDKEGALDIFVLFKRTMESFERAEPALFNQMVTALEPGEANQLRALITECDRHASLENSRQLENSGGYRFDLAAPVPSSFDFGAPPPS